MVKEEDEPKKKGEVWEVVEVATQTAPAYRNTKTDETMPLEQAIVKILNKLESIEKAVMG